MISLFGTELNTQDDLSGTIKNRDERETEFSDRESVLIG
jgi:hypothetical protein